MSAPSFADWLGKTGLPSEDGPDWSIDTFGREPDQALIIYGTTRDVQSQREAASILQDGIARRWGNHAVAIKADSDTTDDELKSRHVLLIGRPGTNRVATRFADNLPVAFGPGSFRLGEATYAHAGSAIVAAGPNPLSPTRSSLVLFAGLGAESTRACVAKLFDRGGGPAPAVLMPAGGSPRPVLLPAVTKPVNVAGREE